MSGSAFVEAAWRGRLERDYGGGPPGDAPYDLLPAAVSTFGAWHPAFVRWVRRLLRDRAAAGATDEMEANGLFGGMLWRVAASLSVGAQRAIFRGIARCLPALQAGAGQLGRPLSEEPEFWRATPDFECVDWVAEELELSAGSWDRSAASLGPPPSGLPGEVAVGGDVFAGLGAGRGAPAEGGSLREALDSRGLAAGSFRGGAAGGLLVPGGRSTGGVVRRDRPGAVVLGGGDSRGFAAGSSRGGAAGGDLDRGVGLSGVVEGRSGAGAVAVGGADPRGVAARRALALMGWGRGR